MSAVILWLCRTLTFTFPWRINKLAQSTKFASESMSEEQTDMSGVERSAGSGLRSAFNSRNLEKVIIWLSEPLMMSLNYKLHAFILIEVNYFLTKSNHLGLYLRYQIYQKELSLNIYRDIISVRPNWKATKTGLGPPDPIKAEEDPKFWLRRDLFRLRHSRTPATLFDMINWRKLWLSLLAAKNSSFVVGDRDRGWLQGPDFASPESPRFVTWPLWSL